MKFINVVMVVALYAAVSYAALELPQCYQYADNQVVGKFSVDTPLDFSNTTVNALSLLCDSLGIDECDHSNSLVFPSVMCNEKCPWLTKCSISKFADFKNALPAGKKLVFTGQSYILGKNAGVTFSCESAPIEEVGFDSYELIINLPCLPGENAMDVWNATNITCSLKLLPGKYPDSAEYSELTQNITLYSFCAGSISAVSVLALIMSMFLAIIFA